MRTGTATLSLHHGKAPAWLFARMRDLARQIVLLIASDYGPNEILKRLSDPAWFQALGAVLGFDWHSSGLTTTVCAALKEGLQGIEKDTGIMVAGGKGSASRKTPQEIKQAAEQGFLKEDPETLIYASKMVAKVDSAALQDGYQLYHHTFFFTSNGQWAVVQQGMNEQDRTARRYHWASDCLASYVIEPHAAVASETRGKNVLNLVAKESLPAQQVIAELSREDPHKNLAMLKRLKELVLPSRHAIELRDIAPENLHKIFLKAYERQVKDFEALLGLCGVGPKTVRALALIAELAYDTPASRSDPVLFSFAHGGKDGFPYPVDRKTYDQSIEVLRKAVLRANLGRTEQRDALRRLAHFYEKL